MNNLVLLLLIAAAVLLEGTLTSIPVALAVLLVFYIRKRTLDIFFAAFVSGIMLDVLGIRILGITSIFFIVFIFIVFQYARKFEIATYPFVFFASFLGGLFYLWIFDYNYIFQQSLVSSLFAVVLFRAVIPNLFRNLV